MRFIVSPEDMDNVVGEFKKHIDMKCDLYREYVEKYPSTKEIFNRKITKANRAKTFLDKMVVEYFT